MTGAYLAVDWGTTNRRAWRVAAGETVLASTADALGVLSVAPDAYPAELEGLRARLDGAGLPVLAAGMIGSTRGWRDVRYVAAPADLAALAAGRCAIPEQGTLIFPGVSLLHGTRADVMRGEEVQVLGAVAAGLAPADALFCQPGTHNKWIRVEGGRIVDFATAMTGELFALLRSHGILAGMLDGAVADGPAFREGVERGRGAVDLPVALFEVRASVLLGRRAPEDAAAFASGVLIGSDVGARNGLGDAPVHLLASGSLATLYAAAIEVCGGRSIPVDAEAAFLAGVHRLWEMTR